MTTNVVIFHLKLQNVRFLEAGMKCKKMVQGDWLAGREGNENICYFKSEGVLCIYACISEGGRKHYLDVEILSKILLGESKAI